MKYLIFFVLWSNIVCSQISEGKYTIGITNHNINYLESDFNLNSTVVHDNIELSGINTVLRSE